MPRTLFLSLALISISACSSQPGSSEPHAKSTSAAAPTGPARKEADALFANRCTPCHGATGGGNGPASASLTPPPRNFHDNVWQGKVTDEHIERIIQYGGAAVGKSPAMPANPD